MATQNIAPEWRECKRFPAYEVNEAGQLRRRSDGRPMTPTPDQAGYLTIHLTISRRNAKTTRVHQLVCEAFHGSWEGLEVNHINGVRNDNRAANLEWVTRAENMSRAKGHIPRARATISGRSLCDEDVLNIRRRYAQGGIFMRELASEYGVTQGTVSHIIQDRIWRHLPLTKEIRSMAQILPCQDSGPA